MDAPSKTALLRWRVRRQLVSDSVSVDAAGLHPLVVRRWLVWPDLRKPGKLVWRELAEEKRSWELYDGWAWLKSECQVKGCRGPVSGGGKAWMR